MNENLIIQLGSAKNLNAVNVDQYTNLELTHSPKELLSYNESNVISVAELFNTERQESESYRIYGKIDFLSVINGLKKNYKVVSDFFTPPRLGEELSGVTKSLPFCFDMYLCYPASANTEINSTTFIRNYVVATKLANGEVYKSGFGRNVYFNYTYSFNFNNDFNLEGLRDSFGKPITELYLHFVYKTTTNGFGSSELLYRKDWAGTVLPVTYTTYNVGDIIVGDKVTYEKANFTESLEERMTYFTYFPYSSLAFYLVFKYNPFIPIKIRDFGDEIITANISGGTENDLNIPSYALPIDSRGNYIWKDILPNGYIDPITGNGVNFPFVNKRHYVFTTQVLSLIPDMSDLFTSAIFNDIKFPSNTNLNTKPNSSLNNLGNRCA
jgi:hypothetical protein